MSTPLVSIITPSFNQAAFLEQTICSVLEQDYPHMEYIIVDGGSTDGSPAIIEKHASRLAWWVSEADRGQADGINKGFARATGEIIAWLNSDDYYLPGAVRAAVAAFQGNPEAGMIYGNMQTVDEAGKLINSMRFKNFKLLDLMSFQIIGQPAVFMKRSALERAGNLDPSYHFLLDHQLWLRIAQFAPLVHTPQTLAAARFHRDAKNVSRAAEFGAEAYRIVDWMRSHPDLGPVFEKNQGRIRSGAYCLDAFYLTDGGKPASALRSYGKAFRAQPLVTLKVWRRIGYTLLSLIGLGKTQGVYRVIRRIWQAMVNK